MPDEPNAQRPFVTWTLAAVMLAVAWLVTGFLPSEASLARVWWDQDALRDGEWWRAVTAIFAHGGVLHLGFNLLALLSFGPLVERRIGPLRFAGLWIGAGISSVLAHTLYRPDLPVVGASGSIFGVLGLLILLSPRLRMSMFFVWDTSVLMFGALYAALVPVLLQLEAGAFIAHEAHLGGMLFGAAAAFPIDPKKAVRVLPAAVAVFAIVTLLVSAWARFLRDAACAFLPDPLAWLGCILSAFWADTLFVIGTVLAVVGIAAAIAYLEAKKF